MAITVVGVRGTTGTSAGTVTSPSWTSTTGSTIIVILMGYGDVTTTHNSGDCTDSKSNTYTLCSGAHGGSGGVPCGAIYYNIGGTRGTSHTVTLNPTDGTGGTINIGVIEITADGTISFDSSTDATATDATSPLDVTAAAAISGTQIAVGGFSIDNGVSVTIGHPSGYSEIYKEVDGTAHLVGASSYKVGETGTPTISWTCTGTINAAREVFATFLETGGGPAFIAPELVAVMQAIKRGYW